MTVTIRNTPADDAWRVAAPELRQVLLDGGVNLNVVGGYPLDGGVAGALPQTSRGWLSLMEQAPADVGGQFDIVRAAPLAGVTSVLWTAAATASGGAETGLLLQTFTPGDGDVLRELLYVMYYNTTMPWGPSAPGGRVRQVTLDMFMPEYCSEAALDTSCREERWACGCRANSRLDVTTEYIPAPSSSPYLPATSPVCTACTPCSAVGEVALTPCGGPGGDEPSDRLCAPACGDTAASAAGWDTVTTLVGMSAAAEFVPKAYAMLTSRVPATGTVYSHVLMANARAGPGGGATYSVHIADLDESVYGSMQENTLAGVSSFNPSEVVRHISLSRWRHAMGSITSVAATPAPGLELDIFSNRTLLADVVMGPIMHITTLPLQGTSATGGGTVPPSVAALDPASILYVSCVDDGVILGCAIVDVRLEAGTAQLAAPPTGAHGFAAPDFTGATANLTLVINDASINDVAGISAFRAAHTGRASLVYLMVDGTAKNLMLASRGNGSVCVALPPRSAASDACIKADTAWVVVGEVLPTDGPTFKLASVMVDPTGRFAYVGGSAATPALLRLDLTQSVENVSATNVAVAGTRVLAGIGTWDATSLAGASGPAPAQQFVGGVVGVVMWPAVGGEVVDGACVDGSPAYCGGGGLALVSDTYSLRLLNLTASPPDMTVIATSPPGASVTTGPLGDDGDRAALTSVYGASKMMLTPGGSLLYAQTAGSTEGPFLMLRALHVSTTTYPITDTSAAAPALSRIPTICPTLAVPADWNQPAAAVNVTLSSSVTVGGAVTLAQCTVTNGGSATRGAATNFSSVAITTRATASAPQLSLPQAVLAAAGGGGDGQGNPYYYTGGPVTTASAYVPQYGAALYSCTCPPGYFRELAYSVRDTGEVNALSGVCRAHPEVVPPLAGTCALPGLSGNPWRWLRSVAPVALNSATGDMVAPPPAGAADNLAAGLGNITADTEVTGLVALAARTAVMSLAGAGGRRLVAVTVVPAAGTVGGAPVALEDMPAIGAAASNFTVRYDTLLGAVEGTTVGSVTAGPAGGQTVGDVTAVGVLNSTYILFAESSSGGVHAVWALVADAADAPVVRAGVLRNVSWVVAGPLVTLPSRIVALAVLHNMTEPPVSDMTAAASSVMVSSATDGVFMVPWNASIGTWGWSPNNGRVKVLGGPLAAPPTAISEGVSHVMLMGVTTGTPVGEAHHADAWVPESREQVRIIGGLPALFATNETLATMTSALTTPLAGAVTAAVGLDPPAVAIEPDGSVTGRWLSEPFPTATSTQLLSDGFALWQAELVVGYVAPNLMTRVAGTLAHGPGDDGGVAGFGSAPLSDVAAMAVLADGVVLLSQRRAGGSSSTGATPLLRALLHHTNTALGCTAAGATCVAPVGGVDGGVTGCACPAGQVYNATAAADGGPVTASGLVGACVPGPTPSPTPTPSITVSATPSLSPSSSASATATSTPTGTGTSTSTSTPSISLGPTQTPTSSSSDTPSVSESAAATASVTTTPSWTASETETATQTDTETSTYTPTYTPSGSMGPSQTPTPSGIFTAISPPPGMSPFGPPTETASPAPTDTVSASESVSPSLSATYTPTLSMGPTQTPTWTASVSGAASPTPTPSYTSTRTMGPTQPPTPSASATLSPSPSDGASLSNSPSVSVSASITASVTVSPSVSASASMAASDTVSPSASVTASPSTTPSNTGTMAGSSTVSPSASVSASPSMAASGTVSPSPSMAGSSTVSPSASAAGSPSTTPSIGTSPTASRTSSASATATPTRTFVEVPAAGGLSWVIVSTAALRGVADPRCIGDAVWVNATTGAVTLPEALAGGVSHGRLQLRGAAAALLQVKGFNRLCLADGPLMLPGVATVPGAVWTGGSLTLPATATLAAGASEETAPMSLALNLTLAVVCNGGSGSVANASGPPYDASLTAAGILFPGSMPSPSSVPSATPSSTAPPPPTQWASSALYRLSSSPGDVAVLRLSLVLEALPLAALQLNSTTAAPGTPLRTVLAAALGSALSLASPATQVVIATTEDVGVDGGGRLRTHVLAVVTLDRGTFTTPQGVVTVGLPPVTDLTYLVSVPLHAQYSANNTAPLEWGLRRVASTVATVVQRVTGLGCTATVTAPAWAAWPLPAL